MTMNTQSIEKRIEQAGSSSVVDLKAKIQQSANAVINSPTMERDRMIEAEKDAIIALESRYAMMRGRLDVQTETATQARDRIEAAGREEIAALDRRIAEIDQRLSKNRADCQRNIDEATAKFETEAKALSAMIAGKRQLVETLQGY